ncbi:MAG: DUF4046 domain-containing protein [Tissierellia bacterium]|nr:DUF4046 domain-containing protein [Tissierellia bacterium]MDD4779226.1 DUF4046 domain-containing protein [Tissierellia bacterium]
MLPEIEIYKKVLSGELKRFPLHFWKECTEQEIINIIKYLFESILQYTEEELKENLNANLFIKYKLRYLLLKLFNGSPYTAINFAYPNKYNAWEFYQVPNRYWTKETCQKALKWLINKTNYTDIEFINKLNLELLEKYNLNGMLDIYFKNNLYNIVDFLYPNKYKPWEINKTTRNFWTEKTKNEALICLKNKFYDINNINKELLSNLGLDGMLTKFYKNNITNLKADLIKLKAD